MNVWKYFCLSMMVLTSVVRAQSYVIHNVHVLTMDNDSIRRDQTLVVRDGLIGYLGSAERAPVNERSVVIDGRGRYVTPGLIDAYAHIHEDNLKLFLACGITTVRNAPGASPHEAMKRQIESGERIGPRIYSVSPPIAGRFPVYHSQGIARNTGEVREAVRAFHRLGYDGLFAYVTADSDYYATAQDEVARLGWSLEGHVPYRVRFDVYAAGPQRSFDNLVGLMNLQTGDTYPKELLQARAAVWKAGGKYVIPTLTIHKARSLTTRVDSLRQRAEMKYVPPRQRAYWHLSTPNFRYDGALRIVQTFREQGVRLLVGSDAGFHFVIPGFSYFEEIMHLSEAGLTNSEILNAATIEAAKFLRWDDRLGSIAPGKAADFVLWDGNPIQNLLALKTPSGVMLRGVWYPRDTLLTWLKEIETKWSTSGKFDKGEIQTPAGMTLAAVYTISFDGVDCGREWIFTERNASGNITWQSENRIDPHVPVSTTTRLTWSRDGLPVAMEVVRKSSDGMTTIQLQRDREEVVMTADVPVIGKIEDRWRLPNGAIFGGPFTSVNLDMDVVAGMQLLVNSVASMKVGDTLAVNVIRAKPNGEEWGSDAVYAVQEYKVSRQSDTTAGRKVFTIRQPGLNGSMEFPFTSSLVVDADGWIGSMVFNDKVTVTRKWSEGFQR
jgi:hypothetical protein